MQLRLEIQGLRALAVSVVILFHAGFGWAQGGYVGVDVFFVISGFLITYSLLKRKENRNLGEFYIRRIRRLFPALLATVIVTFIASYIIMTKTDFSLMAKSSLYAIVSLSNVGFWMESGYWDTTSHLKPLLHTWSLSVEEQFYLVWPALMIVLLKGGKKFVFAFMLALVIGGMFAAQYFTPTMPSAVFYLTPFRAYQFAIGGAYAAYLIMSDKTQVSSGLVSDVLFLVGSAMILVPTVIYTGEPYYLGALASVPCFGAVLIIMAGPGKIIGALYTNRVSEYLGRISYSLYLVHWPIMALYSYIVLRKYTLPEQLVMIAATFVLAVVLYYAVESYFRKPVIRRERQPLTGSGFGFASMAMAVLLCMVAANAWAFGGFDKPFEKERIDVIAGTDRVIRDVRDERHQDLEAVCEKDILSCIKPSVRKIDVLVIGDSHAIDGYNIMRAAMPNANVYFAGRGGCTPLLGAEAIHARIGRSDLCDSLTAEVFGAIDMLENMDIIVYSFNWNRAKIQLLPETHEALMRKTNAKFVMLGMAPNYDESLPNIIRSQNLSLSNATVPDRFLRSDFVELVDQSKAFAIENGMIYADRYGYFCPDGVCSAVSPEGSLVSFDEHHLNYAPAVEFGAHLRREGVLSEFKE